MKICQRKCGSYEHLQLARGVVLHLLRRERDHLRLPGETESYDAVVAHIRDSTLHGRRAHASGERDPICLGDHEWPAHRDIALDDAGRFWTASYAESVELGGRSKIREVNSRTKLATARRSKTRPLDERPIARTVEECSAGCCARRTIQTLRDTLRLDELVLYAAAH